MNIFNKVILLDMRFNYRWSETIKTQFNFRVFNIKDKIVKLQKSSIVEAIKRIKILDINILEDKIIKSVDLRLKSDVSTGLQLSSDIDSSL